MSGADPLAARQITVPRPTLRPARPLPGLCQELSKHSGGPTYLSSLSRSREALGQTLGVKPAMKTDQ